MHAFRLGIIAAAARITAGGGTDPMFANVQLLLHGDSGTVLDSSSFGRTATVSGSITNSTAVSGYFGASQLLVASGASATWSGLRATATGTYTIEGFFTFSSFNSPRSHLFGSWSSSQGWTLDIDASTGFFELAVNGSLAGRTGGSSLSTGTRYHVALVITLGSGSTTATLYVGGSAYCTFSGSSVGSLNSASSTFDFRLGNRSDGSLPLIAHVDEFRFTTGARYTGAFTVPTAAFPNA